MQQQQQLLTHFPSNHGTFRHQAHPDFSEMSENPVRRKSILLNGGTMATTKNSSVMSNDINIITAPNLMEKPILPGIYK